ncbi:glycoside hydrolase family 25 protein, partial [Escherichia coli]|uniref:GH25 family lysozyme n=2 Tax=Gammaproteobacteria TaxID=1236 RepID=UPI00223CF777
HFKETPLWIREYDQKPELKDQREWVFWQYSRKGKIKGIEQPVDLNVYTGSLKEWRDFVAPTVKQ